MNKLYGCASLALTAVVAACGPGGFRSPDFDAQLTALKVSGPDPATTRPAGLTAQFVAKATFTAPPDANGNPGSSQSDVTQKAAWGVMQTKSSTGATACADLDLTATNATVDANGLVTAKAVGQVVIKAQYEYHGTVKNDCAPFEITPAQVLTLFIDPPKGGAIHNGTFTYHAVGCYTDSPSPCDADHLSNARRIDDRSVNWVSKDTSVATVNPAQSTQSDNSTVATAVGFPPGKTTIEASTLGGAPPGDQSAPLKAQAEFDILAGALQKVLRVVPGQATVFIPNTDGFPNSQQFTACGTFSDGHTDPAGQPCHDFPPAQGQPADAAVPNDQLVWSAVNTDSADAKVYATVDANGKASGALVTLKDKPVKITATAKDPNVNPPSAFAQLTVANVPCKTPIIGMGTPTVAGNKHTFANGVSTDWSTGPLCLACSVLYQDNVVDADPITGIPNVNSFADMSVQLGALGVLLGANLDLTVTLPTSVIETPPTAGEPVGFMIARPTNDLLFAELLQQTTISTLKGGSVQESGCTGNPNCSQSLALSLLGQNIVNGTSAQFALANIKATKPFDALRISFSPQVASALANLDVTQACQQASPQ